uniref:Uncharacterized protein n=1 Tax=Avena sativa TaxID=4498 RepID=A0ACD5WMZ2_AVESA
MAPPFVFPSSLRDLERDSDGEDEAEPTLRPEAPIAVTTLRAADLEEFVKGASFDLSDKELFCIEEQDVFNSIYSLVRDFTCLSPALKFNLVEALRSNLSVLLPNIDSLSRASMSPPSDGIPITDRIASHRNALKIYSFFLLSIVITQESSADSGTGAKVTTHGRKKNPVYAWNWEAQRGRIMNLVANSLEVDLTFLFGPGGADERYLSFVSKCTFVLFENQSVLKDEETRKGLCRIIGAIATKHQRISQTNASVLHLIHKYDFTVAYLAEAVAAAEKKFGDGSLAISLIREIGRTDPKDYVRDGAGADNVGRFLVELADRLPKLMSTNLGVLIPHFGGESYKIRNSLVGVLGKLAAKAFKDVDGNNSAHNIRLRSKQAMLEILIERCRDVSAYTRSRVLQVWAELCEENAISIGLWNEVASVASGRLEDKSAIVRKSALQLLITMLQHNPFGPQLRTATFEATLEKFKEKLQSMESQSSEEGEPVNDHPLGEVIVGQDESVSDSCLPSSQDQRDQDPLIADITNLEQIRALVASLEAGVRFSTCIMSLMPILIQLLASSSATDVENTILLLMRCRQFQVDGSEAALRKMLPLVFSQDKSIYEAVESAFISIYTKRIPTETAKSLINLNIDCSIGDLAALENLVSSLVLKGEISSSTISAFEANLQILFTVAESAPSEIVRSNCTIALGDLAVRFPNLLEPWTEHIYARLSDTSASVRKNAVLVISHLILNDMMKVKGYINEMAVRVEDEDERISSLAKLFFHELSKKGSNPIYNLLPDILSRLCNQHLKEETFRNIMQFLIGSIKKDKQMEALVDKLCNRFGGVNDVRQWEYISYCLSQLTYTEKGLKKLIDNFKMFEHALSEDSVLSHFRSVIAKCKKFAKPELKVCIEEFEEKVSKVHEEKKEQEATARNAEAHKQRIGSLDRILVTNEAGQNDGKSAEEEASGEVIDPSMDNNAEDKETVEAREAVDPSADDNNAAVDEEAGEASSEVADP